MFKNAFVRGLQSSLIQSGHAAFPDDATANKVADFIAERVSIDPIKGVTESDGLKVANHIIEASHALAQKGVQSVTPVKIASENDLRRLAHYHVTDLMQKAAEGSTIEGGDKGNTEPVSAEAKMDKKERPDGYAEHSLGKTEVDTKPGAVGAEKDQPAKPSESPSGSNSVTEQRTASLAAEMAKIAEGTTILGGDKGNKEPVTGEGKMDMQHRPDGYAVLPHQGALGELISQYGQAAHVGKEVKHPSAPAQTVSGTNSLIETTGKNASEDPYMALFKKTAAEIHTYIPTGYSESQKIATVRACMGMNLNEKAHYLTDLRKQAADATTALPPNSRGDHYAKHNPDATHSRPGAYDGRNANQGQKQASELPDFLKEKMEGKKDEGGEKKDEPKAEGEKKDDEKKEGSLLEAFQQITNAVRA